MSGFSISLSSSFLWTSVYLSFLFFYTFMEIAVWRRLLPKYSSTASLFTIAFCIGFFLKLLKNAGYHPNLISGFSLSGLFFAVCCSVFLFLLLDRGLDRVFERLFPKSEQNYQEAVRRLTDAPVTSMIRLCLFAPFIEEHLMRGFLLGGLEPRYGTACALLISSFLFAFLHFNMVQGLSAFLCGIVLGLLYLKTDSILCCIIAHSGYNILSCAMLMHSAPPSK